MRVIGGSLKGRRLASFSGLDIRPTSDKVREAVFNILPMGFPFRRVLDLYAGTGAFGIEAISRGAKKAVFVDASRASIEIIRKNLQACDITAEAEVIKRDVPGALSLLARAKEPFDLVFIDPPYGAGLLKETLVSVVEAGVLNTGGVIVAEASKRAPLEGAPEGLALADERRYGDTVVYFLERRKEEPHG